MSFKNWTLPKTLPYILLIAGLIGFICAFAITFDKIKLLENPRYVPSCDLDPIISCGSVMQSQQANVFGFPNPFLGLGGYAAVATIGVAILAGARFKRWFWVLLNTGLLGALVFVHWLFFQSVYRIGALCPWCIGVWLVTITSFWYVTLYCIDKKHLKLPAGRAQIIYAWVRRHHLDILILWFLVIAFLVLKHFWYYYGKHLF